MWFLLSLLCVAAAIEKHSYPPQSYSADGVEHLHIEGVRGNLKLKSKPGKFFSIRVKHAQNPKSEDWHLLIERRKNVLHIEVFNVLSGIAWRKHLRQESWPEFDIEIEGPPRNLRLGWREGSIVLRQWKAEVEASLLQGKFHAVDGTGRWRLNLGETDVRMSGFSGNLFLRGERGPVWFNSFRGQLNLNWMDGLIDLRKMQGAINVDLLKTDLRVREGRGNWTIKAKRGDSVLSGFSGQLRAEGVASDWTISAASESVIQVFTREGAVKVRWLEGRPSVFLSSRKGKIEVPKPLQAEDRDGFSIVEKNLGSKASGRLLVRTGSGPISFR